MLVSGRVPFNIFFWILGFFSKLINLHPKKKGHLSSKPFSGIFYCLMLQPHLLAQLIVIYTREMVITKQHSPDDETFLFLDGGFNQPIWKIIDRQIGSFPPSRGENILTKLKPPSSIAFLLRFLFRFLLPKKTTPPRPLRRRPRTAPARPGKLWTAGSPEKSTMLGFPEKSSVWTIHLHTLW